jgi:hypothetical protein
MLPMPVPRELGRPARCTAGSECSSSSAHPGKLALRRAPRRRRPTRAATPQMKRARRGTQCRAAGKQISLAVRGAQSWAPQRAMRQVRARALRRPGADLKHSGDPTPLLDNLIKSRVRYLVVLQSEATSETFTHSGLHPALHAPGTPTPRRVPRCRVRERRQPWWWQRPAGVNTGVMELALLRMLIRCAGKCVKCVGVCAARAGVVECAHRK